MSLRARLTLATTAAVAAAVALASLLVYFIVRAELRERVDERLEELVDDVRPREAAAGDVFFSLPVEPLAGGGYAQLVTEEGAVTPPEGERSALPVTQYARDVAAGREDGRFEDMTVRGDRVRVLTEPVGPGLAVQVARSLEDVEATLADLRLILVLVALGGAALAAGLGWGVTRAALVPVRRVSETAQDVAETRDLSRRIEASGNDELSRLAASFNTMLGALEASLASQRQLVADASHELRTPLTSLRTNIEVLARADELPREERERLLDDVTQQLEEMSVLVADVVDLARGSEPQQLVEEFRLDLLVADAVDRAARHAGSVRFEPSLEPTLVRGVPARVDRAVANLLDNAVKWSPPGAPVEVAVHGGEVSVRDHGPGIADADLPHVFDRFYRSPGSRSLPGSGLGLAIVRQVAEAHGGSASAERAPGGGALMRLRLPLADAAPDS